LTDILSAFHWYIVLILVGIISFPITFRFLPRLASKGYALSKPLGLLLWGYFFWILCELGLLQNNIGGEYFALGCVLFCSALALRNGKAKELWQWIKENWKTILTVELVFLAFFVFWAIVRATNPEITGTEKPMELAFINAILKSPSFPPQDPWLSGYSISYYYFGYVLIAMLIRISGVVAGVGYNLTSAAWFGLTAVAAFGMIFDLVAFWKRGQDHSSTNIFTRAQKTLGRLAGILGSLFVLIVSNLEGLLEILHSKGLFWHQAANGTYTSKFWNWLAILDLQDPPTLPLSWLPTRFWVWWRGSRILRDLNFTGNGIEIIDEFPFFSYLLSDLHPHVLAMPFDLLAMGICLNLFISCSENAWPDWNPLYWLRKWEFWLTALVLGSMAFFNTWDFPIYVGLFCLILIYLKIKQIGWSFKRVWDFIVAGLMHGITGALLFLPFFLGFRSQAGGLLPSLEFVTRGIHFWIMFAPLLIPIFIWLFVHWRKTPGRAKLKHGIVFTVYVVGGLWLISTLVGALFFLAGPLGNQLAQSSNIILAGIGNKLAYGSSLFSGIHGTSDGVTIFLISLARRITSPGTWITLTALLVLTWGLIHASIKKDERPIDPESKELPGASLNANTFVLFLVLIGIGLTFFPEFFYLRDQFGNRMNTIFKFYFQTWMFWGIAAAYATVVLWNELKGWKQIVFSTLWIILFASALIYPVVMLNNKTSSFTPSTWNLDGNAYIQVYTPDEASAINWLANAPRGIVAEAVGGSYTEYGRVSEQTGMQTVLGWPGHEVQWRGGTNEIGSREADIKTLYQTGNWDKALAIIKKYNIRYIYFGRLENDYFQNLASSSYKAAKQKFGDNLNIVYQNNSVTIYEVPASLHSGN
jgi:YYY domain-containing protein